MFAQNTEGSEPEALAVGREVQLVWKPGAHVRGGAWLSTRGAASSGARARSRWPTRSRAAASRARSSRRRRPRRRSREITHPKVPIGDWTFSNWPLYIDKKVLKDFDKQLRRARQVRRGHQRQRRVLRQGPPAAAGRPADRARHRGADGLHGGQVGAQPLRRAARQEEHARTSSTNLVDNLKSVPYDKKRDFTVPWQSGAVGPGLQPEEDRARAELGQRPLRPGVQGPRDDALRGLRLGRASTLLGMGDRPDDGEDRPDPGRDREDPDRPPTPASSGASPATTTRPTWPRATSGSRSPTPATSSSCRATTRT